MTSKGERQASPGGLVGTVRLASRSRGARLLLAFAVATVVAVPLLWVQQPWDSRFEVGWFLLAGLAEPVLFASLGLAVGLPDQRPRWLSVAAASYLIPTVTAVVGRALQGGDFSLIQVAWPILLPVFAVWLLGAPST